MQTAIPCVLMRGGTSKGPFFRSSALPADIATRDKVLLAALGSPHVRQIDGVGGADPVTSKVAIVSKSQRPGADVDYLFAQVIVDRPIVDTSPSCGNMLTAVGPFAIEEGLVQASDPETVVRIFDVNTGHLVEARVKTPGGAVTYDGEHSIDGVAGRFAPISLNFAAMVGAKTGKLFPTGNRRDQIEGIDVSCVDMAMPVVFVPAQSVGKTGYETKADLDADKDLLARLEAIRRACGARMGLGDVADRVVPKIALIAPPAAGGTIASRYFVPYAVATAYAVTGGVCLAVASCVDGTVAAESASLPAGDRKTVAIEHPQGKMYVETRIADDGDRVSVADAALTRHARRLMDGNLYVPRHVWDGAATR